MIVRCKCGEKLIIEENESCSLTQKERFLKIMRGVWKRRCIEMGTQEANYADDLRDAFNAGLNHAAEILMNEWKHNVDQKYLVEAIRVEIREAL